MDSQPAQREQAADCLQYDIAHPETNDSDPFCHTFLVPVSPCTCCGS
jgi:hypothetical protein